MMMVVSMSVLMRMAVTVPVVMAVFMSVAVLMTVSVSMLFTGFTAVIIVVVYIAVMMVVVVMNNDGAGRVVMLVMVVIMMLVIMVLVIMVVVAVTFNLHVSFAATACAAHNPDSCSIYWLRRGIVVRLVTGAKHLITWCRAVNINKILHIKAGKPLPAFICPLLIIFVANRRSACFDFAQVRWIFPAQIVMCLRETQ